VRGYGLVKKEIDNKQYYYHQNEHGDITHLTNIDEEIENIYQYDVFGNIREQQENVENVFKYAGEQLDSETQQYYLRARFYNPVIARFTQEDVYRGDGLNLYVYVVNNPLLWFDPSGYDKCLTSNKTPNRNTPHIENGNLKEGWIHIDARHLTGNHPKGHGDLFAPGTTRRQLEKAAKIVVSKGRRVTENPNARIQTFEKDIVVNKRKDLVRVTVDSYDSNRVITIFPVRSE
jgi:RHS repeat-associated protein